MRTIRRDAICKLPRNVLLALAERTELAAALADLTAAQWATFLAVLLPEHYLDPTRDPAPTSTLPGTDERRKVYAARCQGRQRLHHGDDGRWEDAEADRLCRRLHRTVNGQNIAAAGGVEQLPMAEGLPWDWATGPKGERRE